MASGKRRTQEQWESLSPAYRARLERNGVSKDDYRSGKSLTTARGHGGYKPTKIIVRGGEPTYVLASPKERRAIARYWNYIGAYANANNNKGESYLNGKLDPYEGMTIGPDDVEIESSVDNINDLLATGMLSFDDMYEETQ